MSFSGRVVFLCLLFTGCNERLPQDQAVVIQSEDSANNR